MKIGIVIDDTLDRNDGVQQYVMLLGSWFVKQGHTVHYLTSQTTRSDLPNVFSLTKNVTVSFNKNTLAVPLPASTKNIQALLEREQYDVLHVQMPYSPMFAAKVINNAPPRTAIIGTFHIAPHSSFVGMSTRLLGKTLRRSLARFSSFISVSSVAQSFAKQTFGIDSVVIPNAIDLSLWQPGKKMPTSTDIVFLGRLVPRKGCGILLRALTEMNRSLDVNIAGDGPQRKRLEVYSRTRKLLNVHFLGYVTEQKKRELLQSSKIAIFPSTGGESFGIVLLEAMAAGTLVLAADNPGYASVLQTVDASLFQVNSPIAIQEKLSLYMSNKDQYEKLYNEQQRLIKQFDVNIVGDAILTIYKQAIQENRTHNG